MNEIKKCSLAGISFTLETDAYAALNEYIASLQNAYRDDPDGEEIVADIEARIAELILSAVSADAIVTKPLIMNIIKQLGSAEEIDSEQPDHDPEPRQAETTDPSGNPRIPRRLYRDVQRHKLGGVCAGIANYFDIDPTLVRLAAIAPILTWLFGVMNLFLLHYIEAFMGQLAGLVVLGYIVMWFTIPPASTARQKLEMKGERITTDSIRENVQQATSEERSRTILADIVNVIGKILLICLKILAAIILVGLVVGVCVLGMVAIAGVPMLDFNLPTGISLISFFLVAIIPLLALIYLVVMLLLSLRPKGKVLLVAFIIWIVALVGMTISAIKSPASFPNSIENLFESVFEHDEEILYKEFTQEEIDAWRNENKSSNELYLSQEQIDEWIRQGRSNEAIFNSIDSMNNEWMKEIEKALEVVDEYEDEINEAIEEAERTGQTQVITTGGNAQNKRNKGITHSTHFTLGDQYTSCHNNGDRMVIFCGMQSDVKRCEEDLTFEETRLTFSTPKGNYSIERDGKVYKEGKRIEDVAVENIDEKTKSFYFVVDNVKVKYDVGENVDFDALSKNTLNGIFGATSSIFKLAGGVIQLASNIIGATGSALGSIDVNGLAVEAQKELNEAQKELSKAQEELNEEQKKINKEIQSMNK